MPFGFGVSFIYHSFYYRTIATKTHWVKLEGSFSLPDMPTQVTFFLEGPTPGVDFLVDSVTVSSCPWKFDEVNHLKFTPFSTSIHKKITLDPFASQP